MKRFANMDALCNYCKEIEKNLLAGKLTETEAMETFFEAGEVYWKEHYPEAFPECDLEGWDENLEMGFDPYIGAYSDDC